MTGQHEFSAYKIVKAFHRHSLRGVNYSPKVELIDKGHKIEILLELMATNFSPPSASYVLSQFQSILMFGMKGLYISASGAIQGHHDPLVIL